MIVRTFLTWATAIAVAAAGLVLAPPVVLPSSVSTASAADLRQFDPGNIIDDSLFYAGGSLNAFEVQAFLTSKGSGLRSFAQSTPSMPAEAGMCAAYEGAASENAATIIAKVGVACNISEKVLLVLLQKEQSLVTTANPSQGALNSATGFSCPDTAACDPAYAGFFYQVYYAARQYDRYVLRPNSYNHVAGRTNNVAFHPNSGCGSSPVFIQNNATAGLYNYTPYQPNAAALLGGNDGCSSYGNRNFFQLYTDWFGPTTSSPRGYVDNVWSTQSQINLWGYASDPDQSAAIDIAISIDGVVTMLKADNANYGFGGSLPATPGSHQVCITAINVGAGGDRAFGCRTITVISDSPYGALTTFTGGVGAVSLWGWAVDPNSSSPISVAVDVDGVVTTIRADNPGNYFGGTIPAAAGTHQVCVTAVNVGAGSNTQLACAQLTVTNSNPIGAWNNVWATPGAVNLWGWAVEPDYSGAASVRVTIGSTVVTFSADNPGNVFAWVVPADGGAQNVCVDLINHGAGNDVPLGCRTITVPSASPVGALATLQTGPGGVHLWGWAYDADSSAPVTVNISVDGVVTSIRADNPGNAFGGVIPAAGGNRTVCVTVVNAGFGTNLELGCRALSIPTGPPTASLAFLSGRAGGVHLWGYASDPDVLTPVAVRIAIDGVLTTLAADNAGGGFGGVIPVAAGGHDVCILVVNEGPGTDLDLGCRSVATS